MMHYILDGFICIERPSHIPGHCAQSVQCTTLCRFRQDEPCGPFPNRSRRSWSSQALRCVQLETCTFEKTMSSNFKLEERLTGLFLLSRCLWETIISCSAFVKTDEFPEGVWMNGTSSHGKHTALSRCCLRRLHLVDLASIESYGGMEWGAAAPLVLAWSCVCRIWERRLSEVAGPDRFRRHSLRQK